MTQKRFIAGAVCPRCAAMDKIVAYTVDGQQFRACVKCDYSDVMAGDGAVTEITTRVTDKPRPLAADVQPLKFFERPPKRD